MKKLIMGIAVTSVLVLCAHAATFTVPGIADPWLANGTVDNVGTPEPADSAPFDSPVFAGSVTGGSTITWSATGSTINYGYGSGVGTDGPNGSGGPVERYLGAGANGISDLQAPMNSLIGVFTGPGGGTAFFMGASGSVTVPSGDTAFYMGNMDTYGWANNSGAFTVEVTGVPDGGLTVAMLGMGLSGLAFIRRKL